MVLFYGNIILRVLRKWNKAVRKMYLLPYDTHRSLGPLTYQRNIRYQLFARDIKHSIKY